MEASYILKRAQFRAAMRQAALTIAVVTVSFGKCRRGFTATSYCSASDEPPTLLVCVNKQTTALPMLLSSSYFGLNLLSHHQDAVADVFAGRTGRHGEDRFDAFQWSGDDYEAPILEGALASFVCKIDRTYNHGSYSIITGTVIGLRSECLYGPLIYWDGAYRRLRESTLLNADNVI